jgi:hypothetical protein
MIEGIDICIGVGKEDGRMRCNDELNLSLEGKATE